MQQMVSQELNEREPGNVETHADANPAPRYASHDRCVLHRLAPDFDVRKVNQSKCARRGNPEGCDRLGSEVFANRGS
jgi:hypothetical protein